MTPAELERKVRLDGVDRRLDAHDKRFDGIDAKLDDVLTLLRER